MGLTIGYTLKHPSTDPADLRSAIEAVHSASLDLPFEEVGPVTEYRGDECTRRDDSLDTWAQVKGGVHIEIPGDIYADGKRGHYSFKVSPEYMVFFEAWPGDGCEPLYIGLALHPQSVTRKWSAPAMDYRTNTPIALPEHINVAKVTGGGAYWDTFLKTQYASDPECGGYPNFLRCHLTAIALLDAAQKNGLLQEVRDDGNYWDTREPKKLIEAVGDYNAFIASLSGVLNQRLEGSGMSVASAIAAYDSYQQHKAVGDAKYPSLANLIQQTKQKPPKVALAL